MALYSVCSHLIESEKLPVRFSPFLIKNKMDNPKVDLSIHFTSETISFNSMIEVANLPDMTIWKDVIPGNNYRWIYKPKNGSGLITVSSDYSTAVIYYKNEIGSLFGDTLGKVFGSYIQIVLECKLIYDGFVILHSACVEKNEVAYAFTGPSGIGKSTRAERWCTLLAAEMISGDRPAIDAIKKQAYGVPWDGKEGIFRNVQSPLAALLIVKRSDTVDIIDLPELEKIQILSEQISIPLWDSKLAAKAMFSLRQLIKEVPVFELRSGIDDQSTFRAYDIISILINRKKG